MKTLICFFAFALAALAQINFVVSPIVEMDGDVLRARWETDVAGNTLVTWTPVDGSNNPTGAAQTYSSTTALTVHDKIISKLDNGQRYKVTVCSSTAGTPCDPGGTFVQSGDYFVDVPALNALNATVALPTTTWHSAEAEWGAGLTVWDVPPAGSENPWDLSDAGTGHIIAVGANCLTSANKTLEEIVAALPLLDDTNNAGNVHIRIDPGCDHAGRLVFPAKSNHTGHVVVTTSAIDKLPPKGTRITRAFAAYMPTFRNNSLWGGGGTGQLGLAKSYLISSFPTCMPNEMYWATDTAELFRCRADGVPQPAAVNVTAYATGTFTAPGHTLQVDDVVDFASTGLSVDTGAHVVASVSGDNFTTTSVVTGSYTGGTVRPVGRWQKINYTSGTGPASGPCTLYQVRRQTDVPVLSGRSAALDLCIATDTWERWDVYGHSTSYDNSVIHITGSNYRFVGLRFVRARGLPMTETDAYGGKYANISSTFITTNPAHRNLRNHVFDRLLGDFDAAPWSRIPYVFSVHTRENVALINSAFHNVKWAADRLPVQGGSTPYHSAYVFFLSDVINKTNVLIENNHIECSGICIFADQGGTIATSQPANGIIRRNTFLKPLYTIKGKPESDGYYYMNRHAFELKRGHLWMFTGNRGYYNFVAENDPNAGQWLMYTPVSANNVTSVPDSGQTYESQSQANRYSLLSATDCTVNLGTFTDRYNVTSFTDGFLSAGETGRMRVVITGSENHNGTYTVASLANPNVMTLASCGVTGASTVGYVRFYRNSSHMTDITVRYNYFYGGGRGLTHVYGVGSGNNFAMSSHITKRFNIHDNVAEDVTMQLADAGGWSAVGAGYAYGNVGASHLNTPFYMIVGQGGQHFTIRNNTYRMGAPKGTQFWLFTDSTLDNQPARHIAIEKNIFYNTNANTPVLQGNGIQGNGGMPYLFHAGTFTFRDNSFCCSNSTTKPSAYPSGSNDYTPTTIDAFGFFGPTRAKYNLKSYLGGSLNTYFAGGYGADIDASEAEQGLVKNVRVRRLNEAAPILSYYKPDNTACTVEYGPSATIGHASNTRTADDGADRNADVTLTNASSAGTYYWWLLCAVPPDALGNAHASGSFAK